jgi:hypothetical protein
MWQHTGKKRVRDVLDVLDFDELQKMKRDLENGGTFLLKLVQSKIKEIETQHRTLCSFCGNEIDPNQIQNYTLIFGPYDFRKKATFCGMDCMESFLNNMKDLKNKK